MGLGAVEVSEEGRQVHLRGYAYIRVIRTISKDGGVAHWATNDLTMRVQQRGSLARQAWGIGVYHRGIKQFCGVENPRLAKRRPSEITSALPSKLPYGWKHAV